MGFTDQLRAFKREKVQALPARIVQETVRTFAESLVTVTEFNGPWTPYGDPALWKAPPPADYVPGNARSSWFLSVDAPSQERTEATDHLQVHHLALLAEQAAGTRIFITNNADHITSLNAGHSLQAPVGITSVGVGEFPAMAYTIARRAAG